MGPPVGGLNHDEVVVALAQMAFIALVLAAIVLATRAAQVSFDRTQAARARLEAVEASRQRLKTLSDRNILYRIAATDASVAANGPATATPPRGPLHICDYSRYPRDSGLDHGYPRVHTSAAATYSMHRNGGGGGNSCTMPPTATGAAGAGSLLATAASVLLHATAAASSSASSIASGGSSATCMTAGAGSSTNCSNSSSNSATLSTAWPDLTLARSLSLSSQPQQQAGGVQAGGAGSGSSRLQHKGSDSLLETCRVLGSVPQETITSTRTVLAAFNYDYSALHRRENTYVHGSSTWRTRAGSRAGA